VDALVKRWVWEMREREHDCCGQKIAYFLAREHNVKLGVPKIYEVLAEKYEIRSKWKKNQARGEAPEATLAREVVQMDTIDFGGLFVFTAVDIFSREADVSLRPALTASSCFKNHSSLSTKRRLLAMVWKDLGATQRKEVSTAHTKLQPILLITSQSTNKKSRFHLSRLPKTTPAPRTG
jgi:hypothetical protein